MSAAPDSRFWRDLVEVGLDVKEARLYLTVLENGRLSVADAAEQAFISRSNAYDVAKRLVRRGLVQLVEASEGAGRSKGFLQANDPAVLLDALEMQRGKLAALLPRLRAVQPKGPLPRVRYLEGEVGIRTALFESLEWASPIYGILSMADLMQVPGPEAMAEYIEGRRQRRLELRVVRSPLKESSLDWPTRAADFRVVRLAPPPYVFSMTTLIGEHTVSTLSSGREEFAMVIESDEYAQQQRHLFEILWAASTPR